MATTPKDFCKSVIAQAKNSLDTHEIEDGSLTWRDSKSWKETFVGKGFVKVATSGKVYKF